MTTELWLHSEELQIDDTSESLPPCHRPLDFPTPRVSKCVCTSIFALDHSTGEEVLVRNVLVQKSSEQSNAYFLKQRLCKTKHGNAWVGVVLTPMSHKQTFGARWESTDELVIVRVCNWSSLGIKQKQRVVHVSHDGTEIVAAVRKSL